MRYLIVADRQPHELAPLVMRMSGVQPVAISHHESQFYQYPATISIRRNLEEELRKDEMASALMRELGGVQSIIEFKAGERYVMGTMKHFAGVLRSNRIAHFYGTYSPGLTQFRRWDAYMPKTIK